jgi:hypothetical protein
VKAMPGHNMKVLPDKAQAMPGHTMVVHVDGNHYAVPVPQGCTVGATFVFQVPSTIPAPSPRTYPQDQTDSKQRRRS